MSILEVKNVSKFFGGVKANVDVTMSVEQGSIVGLIGPNGSGKTTLFNSIVGTHPIDSGSIKFNGTEVSQLPVPVVSFGQQKLLELAMALMNEPKMLLLDEPTAGINPTLINGIIDRLIKVNKEFDITLLVIEHNMRVIMSLAQNIFCLAHGELLANGTPEEIKNDKRVIDAYLGAQ